MAGNRSAAGTALVRWVRLVSYGERTNCSCWFGRTSWQRPQPQLTTTTTITTTTATTSGSWDGLHNELRKKNLQNPPSHTAILGLDFGWRKSWQKGAQDYQVMFTIVWKKILRQSEIFGEPRLNDFFWELFDPWPVAITILDTTGLQKNTWVKSQNGMPDWSTLIIPSTWIWTTGATWLFRERCLQKNRKSNKDIQASPRKRYVIKEKKTKIKIIQRK